MGAGSSTNKGHASRSRFSSWGSSIDEAICGDHALCGDYPEDDLEGFPLVDNPETRRNSVITNPYIEPTPRRQPKLRRAMSEGETTVRRGYTTDYSDNSDDPDSDDDYPNQQPRKMRARSARSLPGDFEQDDFPNRPVPLPLTTSYADHPPRQIQRPRKKKKPKRQPTQSRRPFSPSQLQNPAAYASGKPRSSYSNRDSYPRPESAFSAPKRYSEPTIAPILRPKSRNNQDYNYPEPYSSTLAPRDDFGTAAARKPMKKKKHKSLPPKADDYLADYYLPSQVPPTPPPLKPIRKIHPSTKKEPNYKVPKSPNSRPKNRQKPRKKAPNYVTPVYSGNPNPPDPIIQSAPPIRKGKRIRPPNGNSGGPTPTPFVVGKVAPPKTPYLASS